MKAFLVLVGTLGIAYTVGAIVQFARTLSQGIFSSTYGLTNLVASFAPICLGLIVSLVCYRKAFQDPNFGPKID